MGKNWGGLKATWLPPTTLNVVDYSLSTLSDTILLILSLGNFCSLVAWLF